MSSNRLATLVFLTVLLFATLACGFSLGDSAENIRPAVEEAEQAAQVAAQAAQTAVAQAGDFAGTAEFVATTEGSKAIATIKAAATPYSDFLKEKLANIEPDAEGNYRLILTEEEVNTILRLRQLFSGDVVGAGLQSQELSFRDGAITLSGTLFEPIPGRLVVKVRPTIEEGQFQLEIEDASLAGKNAPDGALIAAERAINGALGEALQNLPKGVQLRQITASDGELTILGRQSDLQE